MKSRIADALNDATRMLGDRERPRLESEILLGFILGVDRVFLHTHGDRMLTESEAEAFVELILRAQQHEPVEYLTGKVSFGAHEWEICKGVLIPRPETEILLERAQAMIDAYEIRHVFEFGIGSGVISISLALANPEILIKASEINPIAVALAQRNIQRFSSLDESLPHRIEIIQSDVLSQSEEFHQGCDLLIANPPYLTSSYQLPANVSHEPRDALFGGERGDEILCALVDLARKHTIPRMICEMGWDQRESMLSKLKGWRSVEIYQDLAGLDRGFSAVL